MKNQLTLALTSLLLAATAQAATVYQCTAENGRVTFSDSPCAATATALDIAPAPYIGTVSTYAADQRTVNQALHEATRRTLTNAIDLRQQAIANWRGAMTADLQRLDREQAATSDDIPGTLRAQQLAIDKQTLVNQYTARIQSNERAIDNLQNQLAQ